MHKTENTSNGYRKVVAITLLLLSFLTHPSFSQDEIPSDAAVISSGEKLFKGNCTVCHAVNEQVVGPALRDIHKRRPLDWIYAFVKNSQKVIKSGDEYAVELYNKFNQTEMTSFDFSDEEILSIVAYLKVESEKPIEQVAATATGESGGQVATGESIDSTYLTAILVGLVIVLVLILVVLALIITLLTKYIKENKELEEDEQEILDPGFNFNKFITSSGVIGIVAFIFTAVAVKTVIDGLYTIGVQQGYQPTQPIAFSHKLHAGQYEIDCNYCHTGVRKSKNANIPSPNICMNCHSQIKKDSREIQKIYAAIDYDPATGKYGSNTKPIEWVRIHNLPDLAYFNHSQHVQVGNVDCQTCHGPIEEMDVVYQYSNLTMGWCINCHRETNINSKGNGYYDNLVELHEAKSKEPMKVEDIGGLECSKCHY